MKKHLLLLLLLPIIGFSQEVANRNEPIYNSQGTYLFTNATLHINGNKEINGQMLIKNNRIEDIGINLKNNSNATIIDLKGKHVYPSFIDPYSTYGIKKASPASRTSYYNTVLNSSKKGAFSINESIKPEVNASENFTIVPKDAKELLNMGFGSVVTSANDGIARGTAALVTLGLKNEKLQLIKEKASSNYSFNKGNTSQSYPYSSMGAVALFRQTYFDAQWYKNGGSQLETNLSLQAYNANLNMPSVFETNSFLDLERANKVAKELNLSFIYKTSGDEYQQEQFFTEFKSPLIVSLNFPKAFKVAEGAFEENRISLATLKHWELAPTNPAFLEKNNLNFAFTAQDLKDKKEFLPNIIKAISHGLSKSQALNAITINPATMLGFNEQLGSLEKNKIANFFISNEDIFEPDAVLLENWVQGTPHIINTLPENDLRGTYELNKTDSLYLEVSGKIIKPVFKLKKGSKTLKTKSDFNKIDFLAISFSDSLSSKLITGSFSNNQFIGEVTSNTGKTEITNAPKIKDFIVKDKVKKEEPSIISSKTYPLSSYGYKEVPSQQSILITNATLWTNESQGILENVDLAIKNGTINKIGKNLTKNGYDLVIDGTNKHVTSGIIDEHSHMGLLSINEIETNSAQVRMEDVVNPNDINMFRHMAGGVTTAQLLHGSANCIGGQSAIIKLKWGQNVSSLLFKDAPKFIKFALGENVKRGNSPNTPNRYPSTRMGVEQVFYDEFKRAKDYSNQLKTNQNVRKQLDLDALVEILNDQRFITCHSYVQSEINMLMNVADSMDFNVNTFTHILEGYKVADKMKNRNINASTFSDWWAYKVEVKEAIPYNASILTKMGVNTAINSDDREMARRLNQEAAKTMLYGNLTEEEAWKTVTLNPAKMLHIDHKVGSLKEGKEADVVIWNNNPLSIYAVPEKTIIDGSIYFDKDKLEEIIKRDKEEKNKLLLKMFSSPNEKKVNFSPKKDKEINCMTLGNI